MFTVVFIMLSGYYFVIVTIICMCNISPESATWLKMNLPLPLPQSPRLPQHLQAGGHLGHCVDVLSFHCCFPGVLGVGAV